MKAEIQYRQQEQAFDEARLAMENARLDLAVLLFPTLNENFSVVDDLDSAQPLPALHRSASPWRASRIPILRVASETVRQADLDVTAAKAAFLPSFSMETDYGIEANAFALKSVWATHPDAACADAGLFSHREPELSGVGLGNVAQQAAPGRIKQEEARSTLSQAQRQMLEQLLCLLQRGGGGPGRGGTSRRTADLAAESLRLINLRYQAGESTALEVVDAQNTLTRRATLTTTPGALSRGAGESPDTTGNF